MLSVAEARLTLEACGPRERRMGTGILLTGATDLGAFEADLAGLALPLGGEEAVTVLVADDCDCCGASEVAEVADPLRLAMIPLASSVHSFCFSCVAVSFAAELLLLLLLTVL